ncbi:MAG: sulfoxide reductase heme-binding subunit YedZ [Ignavibacteriales bacterium]|nr:sulfoxide reductase heme-binding subunit YedZ [Ignavibacteriales bacterium]
MTQAQWIRNIFKPLAFLLCLSPFLLLALDWYLEQLSANPIDDVTDTTGTWTLRFLMVTLALTPLRKLTGWNWLIRFRRMTGLFAFFSVCLHFLTYVYLDQFFLWEEILADIQKRPFITVGFASFLMMIPLALTSTDRMTKWMGGKRWKRLHRLVYFIALGGVVHYLWLVKADTQRPLTYGAILLILLGSRLWFFWSERARRAIPVATAK